MIGFPLTQNETGTAVSFYRLIQSSQSSRDQSSLSVVIKLANCRHKGVSATSSVIKEVQVLLNEQQPSQNPIQDQDRELCEVRSEERDDALVASVTTNSEGGCRQSIMN